MHKFLLICLLLCATPALAGTEVITRPHVEAHLKAMADLYNGEKVDKKAVYAFVKNYVIEDGIYTSKFFINDAQEPKEISQNGEQALRELREKNIEYVDASARVEIVEYQQNVGEEKALVRYKLWHNGKTRHENDKEIAFVTFDSVADCTESFGLVDGKVRGYRNICDVIVKQEEPVRVKKDSE